MQDRLISVAIISVPLLVLSLRMLANAFHQPEPQRTSTLLSWLLIAVPVCGLFLWLITDKLYWLFLGLPSVLIALLGWAYGALVETRDRARLGISVVVRYLEALMDPRVRWTTKLGLLFIGLETILIIPVIVVVYVRVGDLREYVAIAVAIAFVLLVGIQLWALGRSPRE